MIVIYFILISLEINAHNEGTLQTQVGKTKDHDTSENNNEEVHAHDDEQEAAVEVDETAGADNGSLVSANVIQLLDSILERIED